MIARALVCPLPGKVKAPAAGPPSGFHLAQQAPAGPPLSRNHLPFTSSFRRTLCRRPPAEPDTAAATWCLSIRSALCGASCLFPRCPRLIQRDVSYRRLCSVLKSSPALSELTQPCYPLPPSTHTHTQINTISVVPASCPCCHHAAAE